MRLWLFLFFSLLVKFSRCYEVGFFRRRTARIICATSGKSRLHMALSSDGFGGRGSDLDRGSIASVGKGFNHNLSLVLASLSFTTYQEPAENTYRKSKSVTGGSGLQVFIMSTAFEREVSDEMMVLEFLKVTDLPFKSNQDNIVENTLTGGDSVDAYVACGTSLPEDFESLKVKVNEGIYSLEAVNEVQRTNTVWGRVEKEEQQGKGKGKGKKGKGEEAAEKMIAKEEEEADKGKDKKSAGTYKRGEGGFLGLGRKRPQAVFSEGETMTIYLKKGQSEFLVGTVMDESIIGDHTPVGSFYVPVKALVGKNGKSKVTSIDLTSRGERPGKNSRTAVGAAAGAAVGGMAGAVVGGVIGRSLEEPVVGEVVVRAKKIEVEGGEVDDSRRGLSNLAKGGGVEGVDWVKLLAGSGEGERSDSLGLWPAAPFSLDKEPNFRSITDANFDAFIIPV